METIYKGFITYAPSIGRMGNTADVVTANTLCDLEDAAHQKTVERAQKDGWTGSASVTVYYLGTRCSLYDFEILGFGPDEPLKPESCIIRISETKNNY